MNELKALEGPICLIDATHDKARSKQLSSDKFRGLEKNILLKLNAEVNLVTNFWSDVGHANGAKGIVRDLVFGDNVQTGSLPLLIIVQFGNYKGHPFFEEDDKRTWVPITPTSAKTVDYLHERVQIPLRLAHAITTHKAQGQSMRPIVADLSNKDIVAGAAFVTLSRVGHINNLVVLPCSLDRLNKIKLTETEQGKLDEEDRLLEIVNNFFILSSYVSIYVSYFLLRNSQTGSLVSTYAQNIRLALIGSCVCNSTG